jgi:serine phosphatase RsbU (regulator of sigma subunit)/anti-sigma regulatory factor (Ser/Thr protein kinase)
MTPIDSEPSSVGPDSAAVPGAEPEPGGAAGDFELVTDSSLSYVSLEVLLAELLERVRGILNADTAAILLLDAERNVLRARAARGIEEEVRQGVQIAVGRGFAGRIAAERRPIVIDDVDHADVLNPLLRQRGIRSMLGVPLLVEGRVTGVMHVGTLARRKFGEDDVRLLQLAADRAALAIDNAQLSEQRVLTEMLQRILLPEALPEIPGLRFSAKYLPAAAGLKVGGDWYDVFPLDDGRVALVTGDVVGRGLSAAAVMAESRTALRAYSMETQDPLRVVMMLNGLLLTLGGKRSATLIFMALDLETGGVVAVNAGHPPPLLLHGDGRCEYVAEASGPPLGVSWAARYAAQELSFPAGSSMLLYTDGLVERRGESIDDGLERLATALVQTPGEEKPGVLADTVFQRVLHEVELEDDVALLAIEALPLGDRLAFTLETRPAVLTGLRRALGRWLAGRGLSDQEVFDVALAASEAAANAIEHAYGPADATFDVECRANGGNEIVITVTDSGSWRPLGRRQRGRGLDIIGKLMDEMQVQRSETGTQVRLVKWVGR